MPSPPPGNLRASALHRRRLRHCSIPGPSRTRARGADAFPGASPHGQPSRRREARSASTARRKPLQAPQSPPPHHPLPRSENARERGPAPLWCQRQGGGDSSGSDTAYGGGKTHGLIALAHAAKSLAGVPTISEFLDEDLLPNGAVQIAAFDGENADPANGRAMGDGVFASEGSARFRP